MGLLNNYLTKTIPQNARNIWEAVKRAPSDLQALGSPQMNTQVRQAMNKPATLDKASAMQMAMDYLQTTNPMGGLLAHTVYHGSPHRFNKFDMSKIGTGEGAQAYGHGLYFAESPGVAKSYGTAPGGQFTVKGKTYGELQKDWHTLDKPTRRALTALADSSGNTEEALSNLKGMMSPESNQAADMLKQWTDSGDVLKNTGNMYKVDIPDESIPRMLDWDAPLNKRPELRDIVQKERPGYMTAGLPNDIITEADAYLSLAEKVGPAKAAEMFKEAGIPGIRYKDAMSRGTDAGTSNFVLFDDQLARILEINGQPTGLLSWTEEAKKVKK